MAERPGNLEQDYRQRLLRFVSDAVHDLVGPVDQVGSLVGLFVRRYRGETDPEAQALLQHIESAVARLSTTAAGLRGFFQVSAAQRHNTRVNARESLQSALLALHFESLQAQAEITTGELPDVQGDATLLTTLFQSLLQNSLKFRRPDVPPRIRITGERLPDVCRFAIADNGIGIDPQFRETVFLAFRKLNGHAYPGAGLGLTAARAIVEAHGGRIWIADSTEPGTSVKFELPPALD
jgi:light-regulated signal transduction histidine kinase (bacteriophytochrome)